MTPKLQQINGIEFAVADLALAEVGRHQIRLAEQEMPGLMATRREYAPQHPLAGARVAGSLHMTVQTAVLIETLVALGAEVRWASCNVLSTQDEAAAAVVVGPTGTPEKPRGTSVFAWKGQTPAAGWWCTDQIFRFSDDGANAIVDDGGDATALVHHGVQYEALGAVPGPRDEDSPDSRAMLDVLAHSVAEDAQRFTRMAAQLRGVTEETTNGVKRLYALERTGDLLFPAINVNDSVTKSKFDNKYGIRHSLVDGINRGTDVMLAGKLAVVCGYGDVGKGAALSLRGQGARLAVTEIDPICALQAAMDGIDVVALDDVIDRGDVFITTTGNRDVIMAGQMARMKHNAIVGNVGHFDTEIDMAGLARVPGIRAVEIKPQVHEWRFPDGHSIIVLSEGRLLNLGNATGHPSFVMSASFTNQTLAQIELFTKREHFGRRVYVLPKQLDEKVAHLHLKALGARTSHLTAAQADYIGVSIGGPFKPENYRY